MSTALPTILVQDDGMPRTATAHADGVEPSPRRDTFVRALVRETRLRPEGFRRRALSALRKARLLVGDPAIIVAVDGYQLAMPLSHDLPIHRARHPDYSRNLGRVVAALSEKRPGAPIVDIGANVGDSVAIVRDQVPEAPILCVRASPNSSVPAPQREWPRRGRDRTGLRPTSGRAC